MIRGIARGLIVFLLAAIFSVQGVYAEPAAISQQAAGYTLEFPSSRYPETGAHIRDAIVAGHSAVCTIDRDGTEENRKSRSRAIQLKKDMTAMNGQWQCVQKVAQALIFDT
ncbi:hypothetical protein JOD82_000369 [Paenibacillus sp. 1182]|nr:hypothetical protein [Paenibacillus sp. 1182]